MHNSIDNNIFYRILVPKKLRTKFLKKRLQRLLLAQFETDHRLAVSAEQKEVLDYVRKNGVRIFPYEFPDKYVETSINIHKDAGSEFKYVMHQGKRLYFKKRWSEGRIKRSYNQLLAEQDQRSPHKYLTNSFNVSGSDIVADFGAAEGNFALSVIEKVAHIYLFERDKEWIEALNKTFEPWADKVTIVEKYVSDKDDEVCCKGDTFFKDTPVSFLKIDVDGAESALLKGIDQLLQKREPLKIALCTYHKNEDEAKFGRLLTKYHFDFEPSNGYMIFYYDKKIKAPYLRRGLIRAQK